MASNGANVLTGVILMTYGSANTSEHVESYMRHIYADTLPAGVVADFAERYRLVGGSPLVAITQAQANLTQAKLSDIAPDLYIVRAGMLHSEPFIGGAVEECRKAGAEQIIGIVLSP